jgi:hypothetical protein
MARRSPARRRKAPASVVQSQPRQMIPLPAERKREIKAVACGQVLAEMQAEIAQAIAEEQAAWQAATGRPMPMNLDELVIEARVAGMSDDDLDNPSPFGKGYGGILREATARKILRDERIADEITVQVAVAERVAVAKLVDGPHEEKRVGPPEHEDDELEAFLLKSWTSYRDDPNIVDKDNKDEWLETLPAISEVLDPEKKQAMKDKWLRLLRNTYVRHKRKENALRPVTPRT